jgi:TolA-binding protein
VAPVTDSRPANQAPAKAAFDSVAQSASVAAPTDASLAAEIRLLDLARGALAAGDSERAGRLLDAYSSNRPSAVLAQEAALLRVRLLLARGQRPAAAELARHIIAHYPESAHVDSLRRLAAEP